MPLFGSSDIASYQVETPINDVKGSGGSVTLIKSDGATESIFDSLDTALGCLNFLNSRKQYYMQANDDIIIVSVSGTQFLILETAMLNQKLLNSISFIYSRRDLRGVH